MNEALLASIAEAYDIALQGSTDMVDIISARFLPDGTWDMTCGHDGVAMIDVAGQDDRSRKVAILPDQRVLIVGQGNPTAIMQIRHSGSAHPNGQRDTRLNDHGLTLIDFGAQLTPSFGLVLSPKETSAVAVGWKGIDAGAVSLTNNDDARIVRFSLPAAQ